MGENAPSRGFGAQEGVAGERGAGRNSEGRILNGELPSMGASMAHLRLFSDFITPFLAIGF